MPVSELETIGWKSGQQRRILITYVDSGGAPAIVGTNAGRDVDPAWESAVTANGGYAEYPETLTRSVPMIRLEVHQSASQPRMWSCTSGSEGRSKCRCLPTTRTSDAATLRFLPMPVALPTRTTRSPTKAPTGCAASAVTTPAMKCWATPAGGATSSATFSTRSSSST
ncbi:MAG: nitroreductase family deazaflavin-dependent oxidoreductase [bacterium]|nr:nitroreductase family deazaflavin-dependent oxidoreductase [bacterium]